jgi:ABC-type sugar transport system ATPase subunit
VSVIVISHNLEHVTRVADRAVVLRQGKYVGESPADAEHQEELVSMIVGSGEASEDDAGSDPDERADGDEPVADTATAEG